MNRGEQARELASIVKDAFDKHSSEFLSITRQARSKFESRDWKGGYKMAQRRLGLYERSLIRIAERIRGAFGRGKSNRKLWIAAKEIYSDLIRGRHDFELAETFFNSVTRKILITVGLDRDVEYFHLKSPRHENKPDTPVFREYRQQGRTSELIKAILEDFQFKTEFVDIRRDSELVAREIDLYLWPLIHGEKICSFDVIKTPFYRNKVAYLVGRINVDDGHVPLVLPLYNSPSGIFVDTVLLDEANVSNVFGFAHSYFHVEVDRHDAIIEFLKSILPKKPVAELYISIGYNRHGKTEFYRDLHRFVHQSKEQFMIAPGREGSVMIAFTLPDYGAVFKVIKDYPCFIRSDDITNKSIDRSEVKFQYDFVCSRDRVGRIVDTQEFENLKFRKRRFTPGLLNEFQLVAKNAVRIEDDYVIIRHAFLQRKVVPLPIYLFEEQDAETIRNIILDFGYFIKDLAAVGIFLSDLFNNWNYGVTRRGKIVLYDYDDVILLEEANFRDKPSPRNDFEEFAAEEAWISAEPNDFFMDEIKRFLGIPQPLKGIFFGEHPELFAIDFWHDMKKRYLEGEIVDITPYDRRRRFPNRPSIS